MSHDSQKMAVLSAVKECATPIKLPDLLVLLGHQFKERSVRRWLMELIEEGLVLKQGHKRGTVYQSITSVTKEPQSFIFTSTAENAIRYVQQPLFKRKPVAYQKKWLNAYQPNRTFYLSAQERKLLWARGRPNHPDTPAGTYARRIYNRLLIDLSYNSSRLEGNTYSLVETEKLILEGIDNQNKLDEERVMILNHKDAIRYLVENSVRFQINYHEICTLHYLLADGLVPVQYAGKIRDHAVRIGASTYLTLENPIELQHYLKLICQKAAQINDYYEQSFFLLVHLAYLQAFTDVNKRTSRLSANIPLIKKNCYPLAFNDIEKNDYVSAIMSIYELNNIRPLAELYIFSYLRTCQQYDALIDMIGFDEVRVRFRSQRREAISHIITHHLHDKDMMRYIKQYTKQHIPPAHHAAFMKNIDEDLQELDIHHIAGLGLTQRQLLDWKKQK